MSISEQPTVFRYDGDFFAIGRSAMGEAAVGSPRYDWFGKTVYSQYANSPVLLAMLEAISQWIDPAERIDAFYDESWNIETATGWGLDAWGRIVGVSRYLPVVADFFGFEQGGIAAEPFGQGVLYSGQNISGNFPLSDDAFRQLILTKAAANIWDGSIAGLNRLLRLLFPGQPAYVTIPGTLQMQYTFAFQPDAAQQSIILYSGALPQPVGVQVTYSIV